jgi:hypothetical protein
MQTTPPRSRSSRRSVDGSLLPRRRAAGRALHAGRQGTNAMEGLRHPRRHRRIAAAEVRSSFPGRGKSWAALSGKSSAAYAAVEKGGEGVPAAANEENGASPYAPTATGLYIPSRPDPTRCNIDLRFTPTNPCDISSPWPPPAATQRDWSVCSQLPSNSRTLSAFPVGSHVSSFF